MFRDGNWKLWAAMVGFASVLVFAFHQYERTFAARPPVALQMRDHRSQRIDGLHDAHSVGHLFQGLLHEARLAAKSKSSEKYLASLLELQRDGTSAILWSGETVDNASFQPLYKVERMHWGEASQVQGYYTAEGQPLVFTTRKGPYDDRQLLVTVHMGTPIAECRSVFLFCRVQQPSIARASVHGESTVFLGPMDSAGNTVQFRGVTLPPKARLVSYRPEAEARMYSIPRTAIVWSSEDLGAAAEPLTVTFAMR